MRKIPEPVSIVSVTIAAELVVVISLIVAIASSVFRSGEIWAALSAWVAG